MTNAQRDTGMAGEAERQRLRIERRQEGMVVDLDRRFPGRSEPANSGRIDPAIDEEVTSTISVIRHVASLVGELQQTIRQQEELIYDQRQALSELKHQNETVHADLAEVERVAQKERERADRAESKEKNGEAQIRRLEDYSVSLKSQLNSLMAVVRETFAGPEMTLKARASEDRSA